MAKKVIDFLKALAVKAGANIEDEALKTVIASLNPDAELPDELATVIDNGLLSISTAKNNHPDIQRHYAGQAYKGVDAELERLIAEEKLPDDIIGELKAETSTAKRATLLARKIKDLEAKKAGAAKGDQAQLAQQITDLNSQLRTEKDSIAGIRSEYEKKLKDKDKSYHLRNLLSAYKTIHDDMDPQTKDIILNAIIQKNLASKKAELTVDDQGNLSLIGENGTNIFDEGNRPMNPKSFLDKVMADEKILKVTDTTQNGSSQNGQQHNNGQQRQQNNGSSQNGQQNNGNGKPNTALQALIADAQRDMESASKSQIF